MSDDALNLMLESAFFGNQLVPWVEEETGEKWLGNQAILVLGRLELKGDQRIGDLATHTGVTSPRISQLVGDLTEAGFVEVLPDPSTVDHAESLHGQMIIDDPDTGQRQIATTTAEAAQFLNMSVSSLRRRARVGDIPVHRSPGAARYFFFQPELEGWLRGG